jgi:heme exporter protein C
MTPGHRDIGTSGHRDVIVPVLLGIALAMFVPTPFILGAAPFEASMGIVSKVFYFHVPCAIIFLLSSFVCGLASVGYLARRNRTADYVALAAAELCVVFGLVVLGTGPIWARKAWGVWWVWEARVTMTLVMWMVFVSYLLLRRFGGAGSEMLSAAVAVFGMALAPFVYWSVNVWRTMHPTTDVLPSLPASMLWPILWCFVAFVCLYLALLLIRVRLQRGAVALDEAYLRLEE